MESFLQSAQEGRQYMMCGCTTQCLRRITHHKFSRHSGSKLVAHKRHHHILRDFRNVHIALRKMRSSQSVSLLVTQSIDQWINQSINQSTNQSTNHVGYSTACTFFTTTCLDCTRSSAPVKGTCSESGGRVR